MTPHISFSRIWSDDDLVELRLAVCDGVSTFVNQVYVQYLQLKTIVTELKQFKDHIHGGIYDLRLGEFGPEYANGGFVARFHYPDMNKLSISCNQQAAFQDFAMKNVAAEARMYLTTERALFERFIAAFNTLANGETTDAVLDAI